MSTALPPVTDAAAVTTWSDEFDVIVVGLGIAGGCAAVEAAAAGAKVLVLERAAVAGGTSSMAGGHFYLGGGTAVQQATGHADSAEEMAKYLTAVSRDPEPEKIAAYCERSVELFDWLEALGFEFERSYYPEKAVIQPGTEGLMYTGNEKVWPFCERAKPAPRGHKVPVPGDTGGAGMVIELLVERLAELGVEIRYETGATGLVVEDGRVVGVAWKRFGKTGAIRARAVVLAAGGFGGMKVMSCTSSFAAKAVKSAQTASYVSWDQSTRSILLTHTTRCGIPSRVDKKACLRVCSKIPLRASTRIIARWAVEAPVTMLRV